MVAEGVERHMAAAEEVRRKAAVEGGRGCVVEVGRRRVAGVDIDCGVVVEGEHRTAAAADRDYATEGEHHIAARRKAVDMPFDSATVEARTGLEVDIGLLEEDKAVVGREAEESLQGPESAREGFGVEIDRSGKFFSRPLNIYVRLGGLP